MSSGNLLRSGAVMAAGTAVSRLSGLVRSLLLAFALGNVLHADLFNLANTVPNMLYILVAGGIFNAVLVPQLVRTMKDDPDGGEAYAQRIVTLATLFLGSVTVLLVVAAPWLMDFFLSADFASPRLAEHRDSVIALARYCLPQVFFYGMFVLVGQILNARGRFGPMMWAPIANNVVSVGVLLAYLAVFGPARGQEIYGPYSFGQELLLGLGSTAGIVLQFVVLVPFLRAAGFRFTPRFDFRHTGLGHTMRLGVWTVLFVVVNQVAYARVVQLASGGTSGALTGGGESGTGYTIYAGTFLLVMVPHSIITVSLATAALPALSALARDDDRAGLAETLSSTLRLVLSVIVPFAVLLPALAPALASVAWGYGAARESYVRYIPSLSLFGIGLLFFTIHYLMLRGFYALELTREAFWIQCAVAATNIVLASVLVPRVSAAATVPALIAAYAASYAVGSALTYLTLRRRFGGLHSRRLAGFLARCLTASLITAALVALVAHYTDSWLGPGRQLWALVALVISGLIALPTYAIAARVLRVGEVSEVLGVILRRRG